MKNLYIYVEGDVNDGDYINETTDISDLTKEEVKEVIDKLEAYDPEKDYDDDVMDELWDYLPSMDNQDVHTITEVVLRIIKTVELKDLT